MVFFGGIVCEQFASANTSFRLRPPGTSDEFNQKCIRCGLCVVACPFDTLKLAKSKDKDRGMPFFVPRDIPCYMCEDIPCVDICPTDALDKKLVSTEGEFNIKRAKMGVAVIDDKNCVAFFGVQCDACYRVCPILDNAIYIEYQRNERTGKHALLVPVVNSEICTGCGKCERACITKKAAINVIPREFVIGELNENYVMGWIDGGDEKLKDADTAIKLDSQKGLDYLNSGDDLL
ncbi:MAG: ferredoxin-type protein NapG [Campylobacter sp.]|nr:ferredoxin-type protein NapG [Campylobacter sp.]